MLRVVVDTNIFVSAQLSRSGAPAQVLNSWREHRFIMLTSPDIIAEVAETLAGFMAECLMLSHSRMCTKWFSC